LKPFPCSTKKLSEIVKVLVSEKVPRFGLPRTPQNDNRSSFKAAVTQGVLKALGIQYHYAWEPHSLGKVEKVNNLLKRHPQKIDTRYSPFLPYPDPNGFIENQKHTPDLRTESI
jgi:hypothetical protein